jgi:hypothetical protein
MSSFVAEMQIRYIVLDQNPMTILSNLVPPAETKISSSSSVERVRRYNSRFEQRFSKITPRLFKAARKITVVQTVDTYLPIA